MTAMVKTAVSIPKALFQQAETLARQIQISRSRLFWLALENFVSSCQKPAFLDEISSALAQGAGAEPAPGAAAPQPPARREIRQGDVYWVPFAETDGAEASFTHPQVVLQEDVLNRSRIGTVVVCALTSNLQRAKAPGNVLLEAGEANLPRQSVAVVSQVAAVEKTQLGEYIGALDAQRVQQILAGMRFLQVWTEGRAAGG